MDKSKILNRIVKLFKLGATTSGTTESEMLSAVTKARQLMTEHNISMADLHHITDKASADRVEYIIREHTAYTRKIRQLAEYDRVISLAIQNMFSVRAINTTTRPDMAKQVGGFFASISFIGEEAEAAIAIEVFHLILTHVRRMARARYGSAKWGNNHTSYAVGYATRIWSRAVAEAIKAESSTTALVVYSKEQAIARYVAGMTLVKPEQKKKPKKRDSLAWSRGYEDGADYNLNFRNTVKG